MAFDPIQIVLGVSGVAAVLVGLMLRIASARQQLARRLLMLGSGLLAATVLYSLVLTWTK